MAEDKRRYLEKFILGLPVILVHTLVFGQVALSDERSDVIGLKSCVVTLDEATHRFATIRRTWLDDPSTASHIGRNFDVLVRGHDDFFDAVKKLEAAHQSAVSRQEENLGKLKSMENSYQDITKNLTRVAQNDDFFISSLSSIDSGLDEVSSELTGASKICPSGDQSSIDSLASAIDKVRKSLKQMRAYVAEAREKRLDLVKALHSFYRWRVAQAENQASGEGLSRLLKTADAVFIADRLLERVEQWWYEASTIDGLGRGAITFDLQHRKGLRVLYEDLAEGHAFQKQVEEVGSLPPRARDSLRARVDLYVTEIQDEIRRLESKGWRGFLDEQRRMTAKRREKMASYPPPCAEAIEAFEKVAVQATTSEGVYAAEAMYPRQVRACRKRP